ncbi:hypothetical protein [uncultured Streptococcus sp.]|uniref:hypothetical protein n=1 Tax=uncultured Streptococcus sp. TaxID=83427 RepID=UPI00262F10AF|nr:hypothetical protein [uncultured Streptococcus sp.]
MFRNCIGGAVNNMSKHNGFLLAVTKRCNYAKALIVPQSCMKATVPSMMREISELLGGNCDVRYSLIPKG